MTAALLEAAALEKRFGGVRALAGASFVVDRPGIVGLIGPNGAGKTTLFDMVAGRQRPDSGAVRLDGRRVVRSNVRVPAGARLRIEGVERESAPAQPELVVLHEDQHLAVVDKPAGLLTHGNEREQGGTLAELAARRLGRLPMLMGEHRPGIVHRLDRDTSGVLVLARTPAAMEALRAAFR